MDCGDIILKKLLGEGSRCTLCGKDPEESTVLSCSHQFCLDCFKNYTAVVGEMDDDFQCPNGCEGSALKLARCPTTADSGSMSPEVQNMCNGEKEQNIDQDFSQLRCSSCDSVDAVATACCDECEGFLCDDCVLAHTKLRRLMKTHHVVPLEDLKSGKAKMKPKAKRCSIHDDEKLTFFCATCRIMVCPQCAVMQHQKPEHDCVELKTAQTKFDQLMGNLAAKCETKLKDTASQISQIAKTKHEVELEIKTVEQIINSTAEQVIEAVNANRDKLLKEVAEARDALMMKMERLEDANQFLVDRLSSAKKVMGAEGQSGLNLQHSRADAFFTRVDEILARKERDMDIEEVKEYVRRIGFKRALSCCEQTTTIGELFQLSEWEIHREYDLESPVSTMTAFPDGRIAIACEDDTEGLMMVLSNGSRERVLDGVKVKHAAALSDGRFVIIDHENRLRLFSSLGRENPAVYYDHPEDLSKDAVPVCVTQGRDHEHILVSFNGSSACYVYPIFGAKPVTKITTGNVCPQQLVVTRKADDLIIIAVNTQSVVAVDESGSILWRLEETDAIALVPAVFNDNVFIASIHHNSDDDDVESTNLTIDSYTIDGELIESLVQNEKVEKQDAMKLQMILLSKAKLAVSIANRCLVYHGPQSLDAIAE
ncbi:uncharacterized protein LOC100889934 [Strongylocentrotus purpuratus]|uniref:Uncharacterized protein n=1 Tax=Strongylocentrotus purpuratus TaxID=7668 RepID=A0A7M7GJ36_STRPU|nr:uncharacterized protein LOC100889934 [Strongylocentrotus purpuratus]